MLAVSSITESISKLAQSKLSNGQQREDEIGFEEFASFPSPSLSSSSSSRRASSDGEDEDGSVYHEVGSDCQDDLTMDEDRESCGGTILASLSSRDVLRNIKDSMAEARLLQTQPSRQRRTHPTELNQTSLQDIATVQSDVLSFTPTMAEMANSSYHNPVHQVMPKNSSVNDTTDSFFQECGARRDASPWLHVGIRNVQPERVACPFCDREKDLEWRLTKEREESQELKLSGYQTRFVLVATIVTLIVAIASFVLGKMVSDFQHERALNQYMAQCTAMMSQNQEEEMYFRLVTAAFSALVNAAAGPAAHYVFGGK